MRGSHLAALLLAGCAVAQPPARRSFDVATIKRNVDCRNGQRLPSPGRLDFLCVSVRELLVISFGSLEGDPMHIGTIRVLGGPKWIDDERYDLSAKAEGRPPLQEMVGPMLIRLMEERLHLKAHTEPQETPVYALTLAEGPRKLQEAAKGSCTPIDLENLPKAGDQTRYCGSGRFRTEAGVVIADWNGISMKELAERVLPAEVGRLVVDQTGLAGRFDVHLEFRRASPVRVDGVEVTTDEPESAAPIIFTALPRQLGLKLTSAKAPIGVVVVDQIEKPSEN